MGTWKRDMADTLLHSDLTLLIALIDSSLVDREVNANFSNCSSKLYTGMSSIVPTAEQRHMSSIPVVM